MTKKFKLKSLFFHITFLPVAAVPLALAASCGEKEVVVEPPIRESFANEMRRLTVNTNYSNQDVVIWAQAPTLLSRVDKYLFLSGKYRTLYDVMTAPLSAWDTQLPKKVNYISSERNLWARAVPKYSSDLSLSESYIDITDSSNIRSVKTVVDKSKEYSSINLSSISIVGQNDSLFIDASQVVVPTGARLSFLYRGNWISSGSFVDNFREIVATPTLSIQDAIHAANTYLDDARVKLEPVSSEFVVLDSLEAKPRLEITTYDRTNIPSELVKSIYQISFTQGSDNSAVKWTTVPTLPFGNIAAAKFLYGNYPTTSSLPPIIGSSEWTSALPMTVSENHDERNLWVYFEPAAGSFFSADLYINLTGSTKIRQIPTLLNFDDASGVEKLSSARINGIFASAFVDEVATNFPKYLRITYQVTSLNYWLPQQEFVEYLFTNSDALSKLSTYVFRNRLESADNKYITKFDKVGQPNIDSFGATIGALVRKGTRLFERTATSTPDRIIWKTIPVPTYPILSYSFLTGPYPTKESALAAPQNAWQSTPPSSIIIGPEKTNLWMRADLPFGIESSEIVFDFSSLIVFP